MKRRTKLPRRQRGVVAAQSLMPHEIRRLPLLQRGVLLVQRLVLRDIARLGLSLRTAAKRLGISKSTLDAFLKRFYKERPALKTLEALARANWLGRFTRAGVANLRGCVA